MNGAEAVNGRYYGGRATGYEERRSNRAFWGKEHAAVESMLADLPRGASILDIPVGTGRYASIYKRLGLVAVGMDVSTDMLDVARDNINKISLAMDVRVGDARAIDAENASFDTAVCTRLVNWFLPDEMSLTVSELLRVVRRRVIISVGLGPRLSDKGNKPHEPKAFARAVKLAGGIEQGRVEISRGYYMIQLGRRP